MDYTVLIIRRQNGECLAKMSFTSLSDARKTYKFWEPKIAADFEISLWDNENKLESK